MTKRLSISLSDDDEAAVAAFSAANGPGRAALRDWADQQGLRLGASPSEAAILRTLARAGAEALRDKGLDAGYAALAAELAESGAESREARRRYVQRTDAVTGP